MAKGLGYYEGIVREGGTLTETVIEQLDRSERHYREKARAAKKQIEFAKEASVAAHRKAGDVLHRVAAVKAASKGNE